MSVTLRVLFVRHGFSCGNLQKETSYISVIDARRRYYSDPELSHSGRTAVERLRPEFLKKLKGEKLVVCASGLIRAQQTAYGLTHADTVFVVPHISESGIGWDNVPLSESTQVAVLKEVCDEDTLEHRDMTYYRSANKSSFTEFKKWFGHHWEELSHNDPKRVFVFVSHGLLMRKIVTLISGGLVVPDPKNFECYELAITVNRETEVVTDVQYVKKLEYATLPDMDLSLDCSLDTCRIPSCKYWNAKQVPASKRCLLFSKTRKSKKKRSF
jgi:broad specificity phosphatase PhoE